ncbi:hypothetical protein IFR05_005731 [Cadophora sp. M221]|nr:hypothetical protein IFR05_005731 [Cadophora sp. M221]
MEAKTYVKGRKTNPPIVTITQVDAKVKAGKPVDFNSAVFAVQSYLLIDLRQTVLCMRSHPVYTDCISVDRLRVLNSCLRFFDSRMSYMVWDIAQQPIMCCPQLYLATVENSHNLRQLRFTEDETPLDILTHDKANALNKKAWTTLHGKIE